MLLILAVILTGFSVKAQQVDYVQGEVIIQLNWKQNIDGVVARMNRDLAIENAVEIKKVLAKRLNIWLLKFDDKEQDINQIVGMLNRYGAVYAAQKNHLIEQRVTVPNDPLYNTMWDMDNIGQTGGTVDADIDAPEAWDIATGGLTALGDTIVVAVIDGGFDLNH
ncbi:MAG: hypothetical protein JKY18_12965, partial [Flavobacteriales bacterium]|nr:hypothetical protein [Flavobacteriales bacterium]